MSLRWVVPVSVVGSSMIFIDGTAVNVALPVLQRDLQANSVELLWVIEGYALFLAALTLIGGALGDAFGRRAVFGIGIALFTLASLACGLVPSATWLIAARCVQGIGGALAMPQSLALISANFSGAARGRAIGSWSALGTVTAALGPLLGGFLAQHASWRWVFAINLPLGVLVLAVLHRIPESRDETAPRRLDWTGAVLATGGLALLVYGLIQLQRSVGAAAWTAAGAGLALLAGFAAAERREPHAMIAPGLFRSRTFTVANLYTFLLYAALGGSTYLIPLTMVNAQGYTPTAAGAVMLPFVVMRFVLGRWSGGLIPRFGVRAPLVVGAAVAALAFLAFAGPGLGGSYWTTYFPAAVLFGIAGVAFIAPLTTAVFDASDAAHSGIASAINNAVARVAGLVAVATLGLAFAAAFRPGFEQGLAGARLEPRTEALVRLEPARFIAGSVPAEVPAADRPAVAAGIRSGTLRGFRTTMVLSALIAALAAVLALVALPGRARARPAE